MAQQQAYITVIASYTIVQEGLEAGPNALLKVGHLMLYSGIKSKQKPVKWELPEKHLFQPCLQALHNFASQRNG